MKRKGICFVCGWANVKQTLCTACAPLKEKERDQKRAERLGELKMQHEVGTDIVRSLQQRIDVLNSHDQVHAFVEYR